PFWFLIGCFPLDKSCALALTNPLLDLALWPKLAKFLRAGDGIQSCELQVIDRSPDPEAAACSLRAIGSADPQHYVFRTYCVEVVGHIRVALAHDDVKVLTVQRGFYLLKVGGILKLNSQ